MEVFSRPITFNDGFGNKRSLDDINDTRSFIETEIAAWEWLDQSSHTHFDARPAINQSLRDLKSALESYLNGALSFEGLETTIQSKFQGLRPALPMSDCFPGSSVLQIKTDLGNAEGELALALITGQIDCDPRNLIHHRVWTLLAVPSSIDQDAWTSEQRSKLSAVRSAMRKQLAKQETEFGAQTARFEAEIGAQRHRYHESAVSAARMAMRRVQGIEREGSEIIAAINATDQAFTEKMALQAPVRYWKSKAKTHRSNAENWGVGLVAFIAAGTIAGYEMATSLWTNIGNDALTAKHFLVIAGTGALLTVFFWLTRLGARIFLAERHLQTDAEERRVMTQAYLALVKNAKATDEERLLILASLFRSAQDGIVKEDSGNDLAIPAIIAKMLEAKTSRAA